MSNSAVRLFLAIVSLSTRVVLVSAQETATLRVVDEASQQLPCRVHLLGPDGKPIQPDELPFWKDHFCCPGTVKLQLSPGRYKYEIERGPEYESQTGEWEIVAGEPAELKVTLARLADLAQAGWYSADLHVHRPVSDMPLLLAAEDLHLAPVITWWNTKNQWLESAPPTSTTIHTPDGRFYNVMAGEDERGGGALLYFGLMRPLAIAAAEREHPSSVAFLAQAKRDSPQVWVDIEKPFWRDVPLWLARGKVDSIGIAHNHLWRRGGLHNEAWGQPRDVQRWPGPQGNGRWTQEIYYHALNCGLRIPPSAGSASGVLPNPVGYNRCYAHVEAPLTYEKWWDALRLGRVFVTNGPLLLATVDEQLPGHVFQATRGPLRLAIRGSVICRDPIASVEVAYNGQIVDVIAGSDRRDLHLATEVECDRSGWLLIRAIANDASTFRFASTGPYYLEIGDNPRHVDRHAASFFLDWATERRAELASVLEPPKREEVLKDHDQGIGFWTDLARRAE